MVVLMTRRTSWHYANGAILPSTGVKRTDGKVKILLLVVYYPRPIPISTPYMVYNGQGQSRGKIGIQTGD
jgi:hypothetical protein